MAETVQFAVTEDLAGQRVDRMVAILADVSRGVARSLIDDGKVLLDGSSVAPSQRPVAGSMLTVQLPDPQPALVASPEVAVDVVWEDEVALVVNKPAGLVVHPGAGHHSDTLANGLLHRYPDLADLGEAHRWGIVHRIDRTTSGLLVAAKTAPAHEALQRALKRREVARRYLALAWGNFDAATGTVDAPVGRHPTQPTKMAVTADGKAARTHYERRARWLRPDLTLLEVKLETGRTHQIRVHLASIRHPVVGDRIYGRPGPEGVDPGRVWLHAWRLAFPHPKTREEVSVTAPIPDDLIASLARLGPVASGEVPADGVPDAERPPALG